MTTHTHTQTLGVLRNHFGHTLNNFLRILTSINTCRWWLPARFVRYAASAAAKGREDKQNVTQSSPERGGTVTSGPQAREPEVAGEALWN
jgi:hypothetical protein